MGIFKSFSQDSGVSLHLWIDDGIRADLPSGWVNPMSVGTVTVVDIQIYLWPNLHSSGILC